MSIIQYIDPPSVLRSRVVWSICLSPKRPHSGIGGRYRQSFAATGTTGFFLFWDRQQSGDDCLCQAAGATRDSLPLSVGTRDAVLLISTALPTDTSPAADIAAAAARPSIRRQRRREIRWICIVIVKLTLLWIWHHAFASIHRAGN